MLKIFYLLEIRLFIFVDNLCQNAIDYTSEEHIIIIQDTWPLGTYCQWMILAKDEVESYVTLEFNDIKVRDEIIDRNCFLNTNYPTFYSDRCLVESTEYL